MKRSEAREEAIRLGVERKKKEDQLFRKQWEKVSRKEAEEQLKATGKPTVLVCKCPLSWNNANVGGSNGTTEVLAILKQFTASYMKPQIVPKTLADNQVGGKIDRCCAPVVRRTHLLSHHASVPGVL